jgi:hypothetical protein
MSETDKQRRERLKAERIRKERKRYTTSRYGKLGPASPVRKIDPATGKVIEVIEPKGKR